MEVICDCGTQKTVRASHVDSGSIASCGCYMRTAHITHGRTGTPEYIVFHGMLQRCNNPNAEQYMDYGGRGIKVEWESFQDFISDMGEKPTMGHTIERINVHGNYCKENCMWVDDDGLQNYNRTRQSNNTSGRTGVFWQAVSGKWAAEIRVAGQKVWLGVFENIDAAIKARELAELKYYGFNKE